MSDQPTDRTPDDDTPDTAPAESTSRPRRSLFRKRTADPADATPAPAEGMAPITDPADDDSASGADHDPRPGRPGVLRRRRRKLLGQYEQGIFDLGGLALELHRRGLLVEDVMRRKAAEVSDLRGQVDHLDEQLEGIRAERAERRQAGRGSTRTCPQCGARGRADANFCAQCGAAMSPADSVAGGPAVDQPTQVIADAAAQDTQVITGDAQATQVLPPVKVDE